MHGFGSNFEKRGGGGVWNASRPKLRGGGGGKLSDRERGQGEFDDHDDDNDDIEHLDIDRDAVVDYWRQVSC